jgi:hypothetical protein
MATAKLNYDNLKFEDLELISTPPGRTNHICWSCMKVKAIFVAQTDSTIYSLWHCCKDSYPQELSTEADV